MKFVLSIFLGFLIIPSFAHGSFQVRVSYNDPKENMTLKTTIYLHENDEEYENIAPIVKGNWGDFSKNFDFASQDIKLISCTLMFLDNKRRTALYKEFDMTNFPLIYYIQIFPSTRDIFFIPH